jgi:DNA-binding HxlR family transcriptional regulator
MKESIEARAHILTGRPGNVFVPNCHSRVLLDHVTSRWGVLVLVALSEGTMRWSQIRRRLQGVTEKMLAQTLHTLEADGLVLREAHPVIPPRVDYTLSSRGREAAALLLPLVEWVTVNTPDATEAS